MNVEDIASKISVIFGIQQVSGQLKINLCELCLSLILGIILIEVNCRSSRCAVISALYNSPNVQLTTLHIYIGA